MRQTKTKPVRIPFLMKRLPLLGVVWVAVLSGGSLAVLHEPRGEELPSALGMPQADLAGFQADIEPVLRSSCLDCHGPDTTEGNFRIDTLDPDLLHGNDIDWWQEVFAVLSKAEMPPADAEPLADESRVRVVDWLAEQLRQASLARREAGGASSQRRMTRYEFGYCLQDLLGLPYDFARDLPPDAASPDGFENGADTLQFSASQFMAYHEAASPALLVDHHAAGGRRGLGRRYCRSSTSLLQTALQRSHCGDSVGLSGSKVCLGPGGHQA
jgi:hypothetical protein